MSNDAGQSYVPLNFANIAVFLCNCVQACASNFFFNFQDTLMLLGMFYLHGPQVCETCFLWVSNDAGQSYLPLNLANITVFLCNCVKAS